MSCVCVNMSGLKTKKITTTTTNIIEHIYGKLKQNQYNVHDKLRYTENTYTTMLRIYIKITLAVY